MTSNDSRNGSRDVVLCQIVTGARSCFARLGIHRTRMEDIAESAGIVRQTLYRHVAGKEQLVELCLLERCREMADDLRAGTNLDAPDLREEIVDLVIRSIRIGRDDPEFIYLSEALPRRLGSFMTGPGQPMHRIVYETFIPMISRGRVRDVIRPDAGDHDIVEWLAGIITLYAPRDDLTDHDERRRISTFLLPSISTPQDSPKPLSDITTRAASLATPPRGGDQTALDLGEPGRVTGP